MNFKDNVCNNATRGKVCANDPNKFCSCIHTIELGLNDLVELIIVDEASMTDYHPFHLHGYKFAVLGQEKVSWLI